MLKEQINTILKITCLSGDEPEIEDQILNLFKAEVDKLTVIDDMSEKLWDKSYDSIEDMVSVALKIQLQHTKKQLLDLMGE